jgi:hypothetical protein
LSTVQKAVERYEDFQRQKQLLAEALARNEELLRLNGARSRAGERRDCAPGP